LATAYGIVCSFEPPVMAQRIRTNLDAAANVFFGLVLFDFRLPSMGGIGDGGGVLSI
jgi:hypothetical protein